MRRVHVFADESGNFDFSHSGGASRYFILTTVAFDDCSAISAALQSLRHDIAWEGHDHPGPFHASRDPQPIRDRVFAVLAGHDFKVDSLIIEKSKTQPKLRPTPERFYQHAWFYLMRYVAPRVAHPNDRLLVVSASIGSKSKRLAFYRGVRDVMGQVATECRTACWDAACDPCLQVADYCGWAIQRRWEQGDSSAKAPIEPKIRSEFSLFEAGTIHYY